jgi:hypothetical protein
MKRAAVILVIGLALAVLVLVAPASAGEVSWRTDYDAAVKESAATQRPLFAFFTSQDCPNCVKLEKTSFAELANLLNLECVPVKLWTLQNKGLRGETQVRPHAIGAKLGVTDYPTCFLAAPDRTILHRFDGPKDAEALRSDLLRAMQKLAKPPAAGAAAIAGAMPPMGVDPRRLSPTSQIRLGDQVVPANALQGDGSQIPDLSSLRYGTIVGDKAWREQVLKDIAATDLGKQLRWQCQAENHWHLKPLKLGDDQRFQQSHKLILIEEPPEKLGGFGKATHQIYDYRGVEDLQKRIGRDNPNWNPNKPAPTPPGTKSGSALLYVLGGLGLLVLLALITPAPRPAEPMEPAGDLAGAP